MSESNGNKGKQISDELIAILDNLTFDQIRFVIARQECATDREAAKMIGVRPNTPAQWKHKGIPIDLAMLFMARDGLTVATEVRRRALAKAMLVKAKGLDSKIPQVAQRVATEIIEWEMGKAKTSVDVTTGGKPIKGYAIISPDDWDDDEDDGKVEAA